MLFKQNGVDRTAELERRFQKAESEAEILRERVASLEHVQVSCSCDDNNNYVLCTVVDMAFCMVIEDMFSCRSCLPP